MKRVFDSNHPHIIRIDVATRLNGCQNGLSVILHHHWDLGRFNHPRCQWVGVCGGKVHFFVHFPSANIRESRTVKVAVALWRKITNYDPLKFIGVGNGWSRKALDDIESILQEIRVFAESCLLYTSPS